MISLAFGRYILEPFFIQCEIPELAIKLVTAVGISEYYSFKHERREQCKSDWMQTLRKFLHGVHQTVFFLVIVPILCWKYSEQRFDMVSAGTRHAGGVLSLFH